MKGKNKVLLLNPPSFDRYQYIKEGRCESRKGGQLTPPITLGIISSILEKEEIDHDLLDLMPEKISLDGLGKRLRGGYTAAFMTVSAPTFLSDSIVAKQIRRSNKGCLVCAIGVMPSYLPDEALRSGFDVCIIGEPELAVQDIIRSGGRSDPAFLGIPGIAYMEGKDVRRTAPRKPVMDLDSLPIPARDRMPDYISPKTGKRFTAINVQRGCPYDCSFCTSTFYHGMRARYRSPESVIKEIEDCISELGIDDFLFLADTFTINREFVVRLCQGIIEKGIKIRWSCNSRIDTFDMDLASLMRRAGCWLISFGVESSSPRIIRENSKSIDPKDAIKAAGICRKVGIKTIMYYIMGFPGETREEMEETLELSLKVNSDFARFFIATPLPGSRLFSKLPKGKIPRYSRMNLIEPSMNMSRLADGELKALVRKANLRYYMRPLQILRTASAFSPREYGNFLSSAVSYLRSYVFA